MKICGGMGARYIEGKKEEVVRPSHSILAPMGHIEAVVGRGSGDGR